MTFRTLLREAGRLVDKALEEEFGLGGLGYKLEEPPSPELGDVASNVAFIASRSLGLAPMEVAKRLAARMAPPPIIKSVEAREPGYLNFRADYAELAYLTINAATSGVLGRVDVGGGARVVVEHTSVNPNKALHVGHARNLAIGDSLARLLARAGYEVRVLNYVDDTGSQVADVLVGFLYAGIPEEPPGGEKYDHYCGDYVYTRVNELYERDPSLLEKKKAVIRELERGEGEAARLASRVVPRVVMEQLKTCWRLGAGYDLLNWESHIIRSGLWEKAFKALREKGAVRLVKEGRLAGCWVMGDKVLVRSDGTTVYAAKDIPYAAWKLGLLPDDFGYEVFVKQPDGRPLWTTVEGGGGKPGPGFGGADIAITVVDARQSRVQEVVAHAIRLLGGDGKRYVHMGYEVVALSKRTAEKLGLEGGGRFVHMSGRRGAYVNVDDLLDELRRRAEEEVRKRNPGAREEWVREVSESIAVGALRYQLVRQDLNKIIVFDLEEALRVEGETGPYLQYTHARATRILEKAGVGGRLRIGREEASAIRHPEEVNLVRELSKYDVEVEKAARALDLKRLAIYAYRLSVLFNEFYEKRRVIQEEDPLVRRFRLALVQATKETLRDVLDILGVKPLDRL